MKPLRHSVASFLQAIRGSRESWLIPTQLLPAQKSPGACMVKFACAADFTKLGGVDGSCSIGVAWRLSAVVMNCLKRNHSTTIKTVGSDLAKDVFKVHGVSATCRKIFSRKIMRAKLLAF